MAARGSERRRVSLAKMSAYIRNSAVILYSILSKFSSIDSRSKMMRMCARMATFGLLSFQMRRTSLAAITITNLVGSTSNAFNDAVVVTATAGKLTAAAGEETEAAGTVYTRGVFEAAVATTPFFIYPPLAFSHSLR